MTESDGGEDGYHVDSRDEPSEAVLRSVAAEKECDVLDLPPLQDSVDVSALNKLFESSGMTVLRFTYHGFEVTVEPDRVTLTEQS